MSAVARDDPDGVKGHFTQVDDQIFAGSKPPNDADFAFLKSKSVKYVLQVHFLPAMTGHERALAAKYWLTYVVIEMNVSPIAPSQRHVDEALRLMRTCQPIYIHCVLGKGQDQFAGRAVKDVFRRIVESGRL